MKSNKLLIIVSICFTLPNCGNKDKQIVENRDVSHSVEDVKKMSYDEFVGVDMIGVSSQKVKSILGEPDVVNSSKDCESWNYGPDLDLIINGKPGVIVGVTVSFDSDFKVVNISPTRKTQEIKSTE